MTDPSTARSATDRSTLGRDCLAALLVILGGGLAFPGMVMVGWARRLSPHLRAKLDERMEPLVARFLERRR